MAADKIVRLLQLKTFMTQLKSLFVSKESGKGLSTNDYTTAEKTKLAGIAAGANAYTLPTASASTLGGVKVGSNLTITNGVLAAVQGKVDLTPYLKSADAASTYAKKSDISTVFNYKGSVDTYSALPTTGVVSATSTMSRPQIPRTTSRPATMSAGTATAGTTCPAS